MQQELHQLNEIKAILEQRVKFISLSGLSGILSGIYALIGAYVGYRIIYYSPKLVYRDMEGLIWSSSFQKIVLIALAVLTAAILTGIILSQRKAKKLGQSLWTKASYRALVNLSIPLVTGAIFIFVLLTRGHLTLIAASSLIFYGLALVNAGNFTFTDVKYLGICEIITGLVSLFFVGYGLYFWAFGFGILHIIYGTIMYLKYEQ